MTADQEDAELIECARCKAVLNGKNLVILADTLETLCERCYSLECVDEREAV
jgi:hypothetical protein